MAPDSPAIRLRFVTTADPVSAGIRRAELGFAYSHVDVVMPDGTLLGAHAAGGVQARPAGYDAGHAPVALLVEVPARADQVAAAHAFLEAQLGKPYDVLAILDMALAAARGRRQALRGPEAWRDYRQWFCSELALAALVEAGLFRFGVPVALRTVSPAILFAMLIPLAPIGPSPTPLMVPA